MIKNLRKKGFTIVELVIVIAVIAILAAILIPTFSGIIKKANIANDTAMAKNMNTALVMADSEGNVPEDMGDVLFILFEAGYVLENLNPTTNGYYFVWDEFSNQILFLTDEFEVHYFSQPYSEDTLNWWMPMDEASDIIKGQKFSYCMTTDLTSDITFDYLANFDTNGFILTGDISYGTSETGVNDLGSFSVSGIIEGTLLVNAPKANVSHYGAVDNVNIVEVSSTSYHEYGFVKVSLELKMGRLVIENTGNATKVILPVSTDGTAENKGYIGALNPATNVTEVAPVAPLTNSGFVKTSTLATDKVEGTQPSPTAPAGFSVLIENLRQLKAFRDAVNAGMTCKGITVKLTADIDMTSQAWKPIGYNNRALDQRKEIKIDGTPNYESDPANVFMGTFDGNGKTIKGLTNTGYLPPNVIQWVNQAGVLGYSFGLFSITYDATIKNLNMTNVNIVSTVDKSNAVAAIVGVARGSLTLTNSTVKGYIEGTNYVGGAVGYVFQYSDKSSTEVDTPHDRLPDDENKIVEIKNIDVEATILAKGNRAGGIVGAANLKNTFKTGTVEEQNFMDGKANKFKMEACTFKGNLTAEEGRVGGLMGMSGSFSALTNKLSSAEFEVINNVVDANINSGNLDPTRSINISRFIGPAAGGPSGEYTNVVITGNTFATDKKLTYYDSTGIKVIKDTFNTSYNN